MTIDGAPSMTGKAALVNVFAKHIGHQLVGYHCYLHEEAFCAKAGLKELK